MITMDVNGITWVGGVYQKFETMCLEVEENMYQDTVKFVENQVETVGASVKKFYADVIQDLISDSSIDPEKLSACGFPVQYNFDVDNSKKSKISKKKELAKVDGQQLNGDSEVIAVMSKDLNGKPRLHGEHMYHYRKLSSDTCVEKACSDLYSGQENDESVFDSGNLAVKENPIKNGFPCAIPPVEKDFSGKSSSCRENHQPSYEHTDKIINPSIAESRACDTTRESCMIANASQCTTYVSDDYHSSDMIAWDKSNGEQCKETLDPSPRGSSAESDDICSTEDVVSLVGSSSHGHVQYERYADKDVSPSHPASHPGGSRNSILDASESNIVALQGTEAIQQSDKSKLEETCVIVTGEDVQFVPHLEGKHSPYKKKIQKVFPSRMRSARKQEYEQLALWYGDNAKSNVESGDTVLRSLNAEESKISPAPDFCESEWEIL